MSPHTRPVPGLLSRGSHRPVPGLLRQGSQKIDKGMGGLGRRVDSSKACMPGLTWTSPLITCTGSTRRMISVLSKCRIAVPNAHMTEFQSASSVCKDWHVACQPRSGRGVMAYTMQKPGNKRTKTVTSTRLAVPHAHMIIFQICHWLAALGRLHASPDMAWAYAIEP